MEVWVTPYGNSKRKCIVLCLEGVRHTGIALLCRMVAIVLV
jgi:hypothetical protein